MRCLGMEHLRDVADDLQARTRSLNEVELNTDADYVMVWLQQNIRGHEHPAIEVAIELANAIGVPVLVYHGMRYDYPYASNRLTRFLVGASHAMGQRLAERGVTCRQLVQRGRKHGKGMVYRLAERAACVIVDDHPSLRCAGAVRQLCCGQDLCLSGSRLHPPRPAIAAARTARHDAGLSHRAYGFARGMDTQLRQSRACGA